jgi:hypothetical protein
VLRGPESSELEADLANVEGRLRSLKIDGALLPQERELRNLYYTHLRNKLRMFLARSQAARQESGERLDDTHPASEGLPDDEPPGLNQIGPADESWKVITPPSLIHAVAHIRKDFADASSRQHHYFEKQCFHDLHPLASGLTEPAIFRKHFYACVGELRKLVTEAFERLLTISLPQNGIVGAAAIEWASLQVTDLIEQEDRMVDLSIKSACDGKNDAPLGHPTQEIWERYIFWTDWRAPKWLYMKPNGNLPYNASTAWVRMDEGATKNALKAFRKNRWILMLESTLKDLVGIAHEVRAQRENSSTLQSQKPPELVPAADKNDRRERSQSARPRHRYRSGLKNAILIQLTRCPEGADAEICRGLDADGAEELPPAWKNRAGDRSFFGAYSNPSTRHKVEATISKVRQDLKKLGFC